MAVQPRRSGAAAEEGPAGAPAGGGDEEAEAEAAEAAETAAAALPPTLPPALLPPLGIDDEKSTLPPVRSPCSTSIECR